MSIAILSTPSPKATPLYLFESILQLSNTIGFTIPQPKISSHFPFSDKITFTAYLYDLLNVYGDIRSAENNNTLTYKVTKLYTVQEAVERIRKLIPSIPEWLDLLEFLPRNSRKEPHYNSAVASHFGAVLELVKEGSVSIKQDSKFSPIFLRTKREIND